MRSSNEEDSVSNVSGNRHLNEIVAVNMKRRQLLIGGLSAAALGFLGIPVPGGLREARAYDTSIPPRPGFGGIGSRLWFHGASG